MLVIICIAYTFLHCDILTHVVIFLQSQPTGEKEGKKRYVSMLIATTHTAHPHKHKRLRLHLHLTHIYTTPTRTYVIVSMMALRMLLEALCVFAHCAARDTLDLDVLSGMQVLKVCRMQ